MEVNKLFLVIKFKTARRWIGKLKDWEQNLWTIREYELTQFLTVGSGANLCKSRSRLEGHILLRMAGSW